MTYMPYLSNTIPWEFNTLNYLITKIVDFSSNNGFIFSFEFKINSLPTNRFIFVLQNELSFQFGLLSNAGLSIFHSGIFLATFSPVDPTYWYKAVFIVSYTDKTEIQYFLQTDTGLLKQTFSFSFLLKQVNLIFGDLGSPVLFLLE